MQPMTRTFLPLMNPKREVRFEGVEHFLKAYEQYMKDGGLYVGGDSLPEPLEFIDFMLVFPEPPGGSLELQGEVTSATTERALIRFVSFGLRERTILTDTVGALQKEQSKQQDQDALRAGLHNEIDRISRANFFDRLGAHWADHFLLIAERYKLVGQAFGPGSIRHLADPQTAEHVRELMAEAYKTLADTKLRLEYRRTIVKQEKMERAAKFIAAKCCDQTLKRDGEEQTRMWLEVAMELHSSPEIVAQFDALFGHPSAGPSKVKKRND